MQGRRLADELPGMRDCQSLMLPSDARGGLALSQKRPSGVWTTNRLGFTASDCLATESLRPTFLLEIYCVVSVRYFHRTTE